MGEPGREGSINWSWIHKAFHDIPDKEFLWSIYKGAVLNNQGLGRAFEVEVARGQYFNLTLVQKMTRAFIPTEDFLGGTGQENPRNSTVTTPMGKWTCKSDAHAAVFLVNSAPAPQAQRNRKVEKNRKETQKDGTPEWVGLHAFSSFLFHLLPNHLTFQSELRGIHTRIQSELTK